MVKQNKLLVVMSLRNVKSGKYMEIPISGEVSLEGHCAGPVFVLFCTFLLTVTVTQEFNNIILQNEEVCGNTIYSSSEASGLNHIIHQSRRLR